MRKQPTAESGAGSSRRSGRRRYALIAATLTLVLASAGGVLWWWQPWVNKAGAAESGTRESGSVEVTGATSAADSTSSDPHTVPVERTTLTNELRLTGQLSYGDPAPLPAVVGTITALPAAGATVTQGQQVIEVDGQPIVLFSGSRPFWRELTTDSTDGPDIEQLEQNLAALGFFDGTPDTKFDWTTRTALREWQKSLGVEQTGVFVPSSVAVAQGTSVRIASVIARLGDANVSPGSFVSTVLHVTAKLTDAQRRALKVDTKVKVRLSDGTETEGVIAAINPGGTENEDGKKSSPSAVITVPDQDLALATGESAVRITVTDPDPGEKTLVVPVTALLATAKGNYAVEVIGKNGEVERIPVEIGKVADARVQILRSGSEIEGASEKKLSEQSSVVVGQ